MFAVPGWSVAAEAIQTQRDPGPTKAEKKSKAGANGTAEPAEPSRKRKRGSRKASAVAVTSENLAELWEKHIEGKGSGSVKAGEDGGSEKRRRGPNDGDGRKSREEGKEHFEKRKTLKQKKKERKALLLVNGGVMPPKHPKLESKQAVKAGGQDAVESRAAPAQLPAPTPGLTPLQAAMRQKLISSRFRHLNQTLYTTSSTSSFELFKQNPGFFTEYHEGFRRQVSVWPENPVDGFIRWIQERGSAGNRTGLGSQKSQFRKQGKGKKGKAGPAELVEFPGTEGVEPLPRNTRTGQCTIADLGCGDAQLSQALSTPSPPAKAAATKVLNLKIHSFDLAAPSPLITVADISAVPLPDASVDVVIFCLALMGTNWIDFVEEAWRILRWKGECWIGEVGSRFGGKREKRVEHSVGNKTKAGKQKSKKGNSKQAEDEELDGEGVVEEEGRGGSGPGQSSTDVSAFVEVLRKRGFVLTGEPELGNKMFVRMRFVKGLTPTRGKGVPVQNDAGGQTWGKKKFIEKDAEDEGTAEEEARVLKPCVYKTR
jgi:ribosomal RNA-processing protein 8